MSGSPEGLVLALVAALCIGVSKAGFGGVSMISVFLLADVYGAKASVGIALPLLIVADLTVYPLFRQLRQLAAGVEAAAAGLVRDPRRLVAAGADR